jgi:LPS sulfotransferase NodH
MTTQSKTKFIIFGQGRSGINLLRTLLKSHPMVQCDNELFNPVRLAQKSKMDRFFINIFPINYIYNMQKRTDAEIYGFKFFAFHHKNAGSIVKNLYRQGWKVIHIERKNILKQAFSGIIGTQTQKYIRRDYASSPDQIYHIECDQVINVLRFRKKHLAAEYEILSAIGNYCSVIYEDDLSDQKNWDETMSRIFQFLGIEPVIVKSSILITDSRPDSERIDSFDEIIRCLNETGYSKVVEDYYKYL